MADEKIAESRLASDTCERCTGPHAKSYIVTKPDGDVRRDFCEKCRDITAETYDVKAAGKTSAPKDAEPPAVTKSPTGRNP